MLKNLQKVPYLSQRELRQKESGLVQEGKKLDLSNLSNGHSSCLRKSEVKEAKKRFIKSFLKLQKSKSPHTYD